MKAKENWKMDSGSPLELRVLTFFSWMTLLTAAIVAQVYSALLDKTSCDEPERIRKGV